MHLLDDHSNSTSPSSDSESADDVALPPPNDISSSDGQNSDDVLPPQSKVSSSDSESQGESSSDDESFIDDGESSGDVPPPLLNHISSSDGQNSGNVPPPQNNVIRLPTSNIDNLNIIKSQEESPGKIERVARYPLRRKNNNNLPATDKKQKK